jgi:hypothetical protein
LRPSSVRPQLLKIFSSETTWPIKTKLWWNGPWVILFHNGVRQSRHPTNMAAVTKNNQKGDEILEIFISETTGPIGTKLSLNSPWMIPFQNCVRQSRPPTNMATVAKNRKKAMKFKKQFPLKLLGQLDPSFSKINLW